jgi:hypothetical protein
MEIPSRLPIQDLNSTWSFSVLHTVMLAPSGPSFFSWVDIEVIIEISIKIEIVDKISFLFEPNLVNVL